MRFINQMPRPRSVQSCTIPRIIERAFLQAQATATDTAIEAVAGALQFGDAGFDSAANGFADPGPVALRWGAALGEGPKASHLTYLGDASVGEGANIGAGTITCNYDGYFKYQTEIGAGAFIGSNSALVAPAKIGDGAIVGAGSVVTKDVEADALAHARGEQSAKPGWDKKFREVMTRKKAAKN